MLGLEIPRVQRDGEHGATFVGEAVATEEELVRGGGEGVVRLVLKLREHAQREGP